MRADRLCNVELNRVLKKKSLKKLFKSGRSSGHKTGSSIQMKQYQSISTASAICVNAQGSNAQSFWRGHKGVAEKSMV